MTLKLKLRLIRRTINTTDWAAILTFFFATIGAIVVVLLIGYLWMQFIMQPLIEKGLMN